MKKLAGFFCFSLMFGMAYAADIEATVVDADPGDDNGEINLEVTGGVSPFQFDWSGPDGFSSTDEDLSGLEPGTYTVTVTDQFCGVATLEVEVAVAGQSSVDEEELFELSVYPNPTTGLIYLTSPEKIDVVVFNVLGKSVWRGKNVQQIDLTDYPGGIYLIQAGSEKGVLTRKITLQ